MGQIYNSKKLMDDIARLQSSHDLIELLSGIQQKSRQIPDEHFGKDAPKRLSHLAGIH